MPAPAAAGGPSRPSASTTRSWSRASSRSTRRAQYWLGVGAQPTEPVQHLLEITGDWQKFKGLPGAEGTLKPQPTKPDKLERFNAALAAAGEEPTTEATTPRKRADRRPKADDAPEATDEAPAES